MKKKFLLIAFCWPILTTYAENIPSLLMVWNTDGSTQAYALSEKPILTLSDSELTITTSSITAHHSLDGLARFTYEKNPDSGVSNLLADGKKFRIDQESICFPHLEAGSTIVLYRTDGYKVLSKEIANEGAYAFPLSGLSSGIYLLQINGRTSKIAIP